MSQYHEKEFIRGKEFAYGSSPDQPVEKQARRHAPAIVAIIVALVVAVIAFFVFGASDPETLTDEPTATTDAPATTDATTEATTDSAPTN